MTKVKRGCSSKVLSVLNQAEGYGALRLKLGHARKKTLLAAASGRTAKQSVFSLPRIQYDQRASELAKTNTMINVRDYLLEDVSIRGVLKEPGELRV